MKKCVLPAVLTYILGLGTMGAVVTWRHTETLTVDQAIAILNDDLTAEQRKLVAAALGRQGLAAIRGLFDLATAGDAAAVEAVRRLEMIREALK